ncbi:FUSC family protein [Candidatus Dojkabacteria bacterium]|uniref:FUSC family protein n=1 Tax=Candidatus Dojkabacteria bacterium TaxID=2099670 RepID=A0A955RHX8_9BACT|nr:FUSC family protein [Candidatus Dojkabacteria bacterium]
MKFSKELKKSSKAAKVQESKKSSDVKSQDKSKKRLDLSSMKDNLSWSEALRALVIMLPTLIFAIFGSLSLAVPLGQAGFFFSTIPLIQRRPQRLILGGIVATIGLGFYLMGGNVVFNPFVSIGFTFFIALNLALLVSWELTGMLAFTFFTIYSAGLNASSAEKVHDTFLMFLLAIVWGATVSLFKFWKTSPAMPKPQVTIIQQINTGLRLGLGTSVALAVANIFSFGKFGWAPSAVSNVVRFDENTSRKRAVGRLIATLGGVAIAAVLLSIFFNYTYVLLVLGVLLAVLNGLFRNTKLGQIPLLYTATILLLYSLTDLTNSRTLMLERIGYNVIGVLIGLFVVIFPFPYLSKRLRAKYLPK